jgi:phage gp29-like protein
VADKQAPERDPRNVAPIGDHGLKAYGGYIQEEFLRELTGEQGRRKFREMASNDPTVRAIIFGLTALTCSVEWALKAADETDEAEKAKEFVEDILKKMKTPLSDVIAEACTMFIYGFAPCEIVFAPRDDGKIGIQEISLRAQNTIQRWVINQQTGELEGLVQQTTFKGTVTIPIDRVALFRTTSVKNNPEGESILRGLYRPWYFKSKIEEIEAVGIERDLAGLPVVRVPMSLFNGAANGDPDAIRALDGWKRLATQVRRDQNEGVVIPSDVQETDDGKLVGTAPMYEFKLLSSGGGRSFDTTAIIDRYDRKIATAVLMDFIFLGQASVGSFALSSDKTALFAQALGSYVKRMAEVLNRQVLKRLWDLNALDPALMPTFEPGDLEKPDLGELAAFVSTMAGAGAQLFVSQDDQNWVRKIAGMPPAPEEGLGDMGVPVEPEPKPKPKSGGAAEPVKKSAAEIADEIDQWILAHEEAA